jgi:hypothetical protein
MGGSAGVTGDIRTSAASAFDPETTHAMSVAFDGARWVLGLAIRSSDAADRLAQMIVAAAMTGERDPWRPRAAALRRFEH